MNASSPPVGQPAIVLTGTIVPNIQGHHQHLDISARRAEYLRAIEFYREFANVYFLENSSYALLEDEAFISIPNTMVKQFPVSEYPHKGRGFQEFELIDRWIASERDLPASWIKVTGRYIYLNFSKIWAECCGSTSPFIINQYPIARLANTAIFSVQSDFYRQYITNLYLACDDDQEWFIEKAMYKLTEKFDRQDFCRFRTSLHCTGIAGYNGKEIQSNLKDALNRQIAALTYKFDRHYIWLSF